MKKFKTNTLLLIGILLLSAVLNFIFISKEGYGNSYYAAAVKSMLMNFKNFFFVSFDPAGFVTVDKPPVGLWIQTLSAVILGYKGWALLLPQALAGVGSVGLLYYIVKKHFGEAAGLLAALILAITPITVAVNRNNTIDSLLVFFLLLAAAALNKAMESGKLKWLLLSMTLVGIGFNIKTLQAYMVLPAFYLVYLLTLNLNLKTKMKNLAISTAVLLIVSLTWAVIVDLTPADKRPYVGSSSTNSEINLLLGYNGIGRLTGSSSPMNGSKNNSTAQRNMTPPTGFPNGRDGKNFSSGNIKNGMTQNEAGSAGIGRLFNSQLFGQISWMISFFGIGILAVLANYRKKLFSVEKRNQLIFWCSWFIPQYIFFSIAGMFHRYYLTMLAPAIAALTAITLPIMKEQFIEKDWKRFFLPAAILLTVIAQSIFITNYSDVSKWLIPLIVILALTSIVLLFISQKKESEQTTKLLHYGVGIAFTAMLLTPFYWSWTPALYGDNSVIPLAGPELNKNANYNRNGMNRMGPPGINRPMSGNMPMANPMEGASNNKKLINYLIKNKRNAKYVLAVSRATEASSIIIETGQPVMAMGGFLGSDPILTVEKLESMVKKGEIRYFLISGDMNDSNEITAWIKQHGKVVDKSLWSDSTNKSETNNNFRDKMMGEQTLYDCQQ